MAYYGSSFHGGHDHRDYYFDGEYPSTNYNSNYPRYQHDYDPIAQDSALYRSDDFYYTDYASSIACEPLFLAYEPSPSLTHYSESYQTLPIVSYSVMEFNEDDFFEYDPTPYGGGYDIVQIYGNPLPYSDETCYPRSTANPVAGGPGEQPLPRKEKEPTSQKIAAEGVTAGIGQHPSSTADPVAASAAGKPPQMENEKEPRSPELAVEEAVGKGNGGGYGYPEGRVIPAGSGLETVDLCESLFGYWPCLEKCRRESENAYGVKTKEVGDWNEMAADYLFGSWSYDAYDGGRREYDYRQRPEESERESEQPLPWYRRPADMYVEDVWYNGVSS